MSKMSKCEVCGLPFDDATPDTPFVVCPKCERKLVNDEKKYGGHVSSDGGFGPRPTYGRKVGGPLGADTDAFKLKDPD
jgi:hypothetical protein